jgi:hypothetical protein
MTPVTRTTADGWVTFAGVLLLLLLLLLLLGTINFIDGIAAVGIIAMYALIAHGKRIGYRS